MWAPGGPGKAGVLSAGILIGRRAFLLLRGSQRSQGELLSSNLLWSMLIQRGWQLTRQQGTVSDNYVTRGRVSRDEGAQELQTPLCLPGGEVPACSKRPLCARTENAIQRVARTGSEVMFAPPASKGRAWKKPLARAATVDCCGLRFKLPSIKLSALAFLLLLYFRLENFLLKPDIYHMG